MARFTQAISEGDGISLIPTLAGDVATLAGASETSGAEAVAVASPADAERVRAAAGLPVLLHRKVRSRAELEAASDAGADAVVIDLPKLDDDDALQDIHTTAHELGFDVAVDVGDDEDLERALELVDPDIVWICDRSGDHDEAFERTLDLLPDVPAGKLVISESRRIVREQVVALERAGVDALVVADAASGEDFARTLADLGGGDI